MPNSKTFIYDGSFNGFLTTVFVAFGEKTNVTDIQRNTLGQSVLFSETEMIFTRSALSKRVWDRIRNKNHGAATTIYFAFLSETQGVELMLYTYIQKLMDAKDESPLNHPHADILHIDRLARKVGREKHRMEDLVHFQLTKDDLLFATIKPDFNVLPLISKHFRNRCTDRQWLIYNVGRKYGIFHTMEHMEMVSLNLSEVDAYPNREYNCQTLWNDYFKNTRIGTHIKRKPYLEHSTEQYPKYLLEKRETT